MASGTLSAVQTTTNPHDHTQGLAQVEAELRGVLADSYILMTKTQAVHWNATGPMFLSLHQLTEDHYKDLFDAVDDLAERLRALGSKAPSSIAEIVAPGNVEDGIKDVGTERMVATLARDHRALSARLQAAINVVERDVATADLLTERLRFHDKAAWLLHAMIQ